jgi:hypothetical protein
MPELLAKLESAGLRASLRSRSVDRSPGQLSAVVSPLTPRELPLALANLDRWTRLLGKRMASERNAKGPRLIFSFNCAHNSGLERKLQNKFRRSPELMSSFAGLEVRFCDLPPEKDVYVKNSPRAASPYGNKSGPNWLFYETLKRLRHECEFIFLMETDCEPISPDWLGRLEDTCEIHKDAWIVGSHYRGVSPLSWRVARHLNGNALYHVGDARFWEFMDGLLWPWMLDHIARVNPNLAYDCAWETFLNRPEMEDASHYDWIVARALLDRFRTCGTIVNIAGEAEQRGDYSWTKEDIVRRFPDAVVVHGPLAPAVRTRGGIALGPWRFNGKAVSPRKPMTVRPAGRLERSLWERARPLEPGDTLQISAVFSCPSSNGLKIEIRNPIGRLLERLKMPAGGDKTLTAATISHVFAAPHPFVRIWFLHLHAGKNQRPIELKQATVEVWRGSRQVEASRDILS